MAQPDNLLDLLEDDEDEEVRLRLPEPPVDLSRIATVLVTYHRD